MANDPEYVLGTHDAEVGRLHAQHRTWGDVAHAAWRRAGLRPGDRVLDVGCGPGFAAFDLAAIVAPGATPGSIVAVDESARFCALARAGARARGIESLVAVEQHDVQELPEELGTFDGAYARWVLCFVPRPEAVVAGVARRLRPGGRFIVHDYFNYESMTLAPRRPAFARVLRAVAASFRARGGDPDVVGRLPRLMREAGLDVSHLDVHQRLARPGDGTWSWPDLFFRGFVPRLVEGGFLAAAEAGEWLEEWEDFAREPGGFMSLPPVYEVIGVKR